MRMPGSSFHYNLIFFVRSFLLGLCEQLEVHAKISQIPRSEILGYLEKRLSALKNTEKPNKATLLEIEYVTDVM